MAEKFEYTREWTDANAFPMLGFSKSWKNPEDYPTIELDEKKVREDMQSLHDEVKDYINTKLIPAVLAEDATEEARSAAEAQRETNENQRIENENTRIAAEQSRASAETARDAAEQARVAAEEKRVSDEASRMNKHLNWERQHKLWEDAEEGRVSAEASRVAAEQERGEAETSRVNAELNRRRDYKFWSDDEASRKTAEQSRASAEQARASAETERDAAEQERVAAETARADETSGIVARATEQANVARSAATSAGNSATEAAASESAAASSASSAAGSAAAASTSETNAKASETAAKASETAAKASETAAKTSETTAKSEADRAKSEADRAAGIVGGDYATKTDLAAHTDDADIHVTAEEKTAWSGKQEAVERFSVSLSSDYWDSDTMTQTVEDEIFIKSGYTYIVAFSTSNNDVCKRYIACGIYAQRVMTDGEMIFKTRKIPMDSFSVTVVRISSINGSGQVINSSSFWADVEDLSKDEQKAIINSSLSIPNGRMIGDVDGDGEIANLDVNLIMKISSGLFIPTDIQRQCANLDGDGVISSSDALAARNIINGKYKLGKYSSDVLGNWTVNPNYATEDAQFYTDIPVGGMAAGQDISIIIGGGKESSKIVKVEAIDDAMRVWATSLPIEALPYKIVQDGPKTVSVTLAAASWDSTAKTQTVTVTGVKASETAQMITPTPALASQTSYYEAGILCTGQAADSLTFTCKTVPTADLTVYVVVEELVSG